MAENFTIKPKTLTKKLISVLPEKAQDIIKKRFGLEDDSKRMTLEAIGQIYGITRERVRQIENFALQSIKKSPVYAEFDPVFEHINEHMDRFGRGLAHEESFLGHVTGDNGFENHYRFYMVLGDDFERLKEDDDFHQRWTTDAALSEKVHQALHALKKSLGENDLMSEEEILSRFHAHLKAHVKGLREDDEVLKRWLSLSKAVAQNPMGDWGNSASPSIKVRGMRDLAFLVLRKHGKPLHFEDVAKAISEHFGRPAHVATCHNELIKDERFVLVGRGLYALTEWGYRRGTVRDIIQSVLKNKGALHKHEIVEQVSKERYVKESTISVNLQNGKFFRRETDGRYSIAE